MSKPLQLGADLFSQERRNNTLSLLFLSGLNAGEIFLSKLLGVALMAFYDLLALLPFFALPFVLGGVQITQFLSAACFLPNLLLFTLAVSMLASILFDDESTASTTAWVIAAGLCLIPMAIYFTGRLFSGPLSVSNTWLLFSPAYGPYLVFKAFKGGSGADFWINSFITFAYSLTALGMAARILSATWRERPNSSFRRNCLCRCRDWIRGTAAWRQALRRRWLNQNPFVWLSARDRRPMLTAWTWVIGFTCTWLVCLLAWPKAWPSVANFLISAAVLNWSLGSVYLYAAAKRIGEDRRSGAMELLLTTPLSVEQIVEGSKAALHYQFRPLFRIVLGINLALLATGFLVRGWTRLALAVYLLCWMIVLSLTFASFLKTTPQAMWISLNCARPGYAARKASGPAWVWIYGGYILFRERPYVSGFPTGSVAELFVTFCVMALIAMAFVAGWEGKTQSRELKEHFRAIAQEPVPDPSDARFKSWDVSKRFPLSRDEWLLRRHVARARGSDS